MITEPRLGSRVQGNESFETETKKEVPGTLLDARWLAFTVAEHGLDLLLSRGEGRIEWVEFAGSGSPGPHGPGAETVVKTLKVQRIAKILLLLVLLLAAVVIARNFLGRQQEEVAASEHDLLTEDVSRRSMDFEHEEFRDGDLLFRVRAESDTLTAQGEHRLEQVELIFFDPQGNPTDWIRGSQAVYGLDTRQIQFQDSVQIRLADQTEIFSDRLSADLAAQRIDIDQRFRFRRGDARGQGGALRYFTALRRLEILEHFELQVPTGSLTEARSSRAVYDLVRGTLQLSGGARLRHPLHQLESSRLDIDLDAQRRVRRLSARGDARLQTPPRRSFSGDRIDFEFDSQSGLLSSFEVLGNGERNASFEQSEAGAVRLLLARRLRVLPGASREDPAAWRLDRFSANQDVVLRSPGKQLQELRSDQLQGQFDQQETLRRLELTGDVRAVGAGGERLQSHRLTIGLDSQERPSSILAERQVEVVAPFAEGQRRLSTPSQLELDFQEGLLSRLFCPRQCSVTSVSGGETTRLEAPSLTARFAAGRPEEVQAGPGVRVSSEEAGRRRVSESRELTLRYRDGLLAEARQEGEFRLRDQVGDSTTVLTGQGAVLDPATDWIRVEGGQPRLTRSDQQSGETVTTSAKVFLLQRFSNQLEAREQVRSTVYGQGKPMEITAESMRLEEDGWIDYQGSPRLQEQNNRLVARSIRLHPGRDLLEARREVDSLVRAAVPEGPEGAREYHIRSDFLRLERQHGVALYEGNVEARSDRLQMKSASLQLEFADLEASRVEKVNAWGGVRVWDADRTATGDRSVYFPAEGKVQVFGNPAIATDSQQGKAFGAVLTFFTGDERMLVQKSGAEGEP